jgi:hypothetical protein
VPVPSLSPPEVRVIFHNGDFLTLSDVAADARTMTGNHKLLGPVTLDLAAVRALNRERSARRSGQATKQSPLRNAAAGATGQGRCRGCPEDNAGA